MISLFILGAFIGSGVCLSIDLLSQNKVLKEDNKRLEEENKKYLKNELDKSNTTYDLNE